MVWVGTGSRQRARSEVADFADAIRRNGVGLVVWVALCAAAAVLALAGMPTQYTATTQIVLEPPARADDRTDIVRFFHQLTLDDAQAQTELHVILSERLLRYVFDILGLDGNQPGPEGNPSPVGQEEIRAEHERLFQQFRDGVRARRIGISYVIEISYTAQDRAEASRIANAIAAAYLRERITTAAAEAGSVPVVVKRRMWRMLDETTAATDAVKAGAVPESDFPDAAVRLLGAAARPTESYPKVLPLIEIAVWFGVISGLLVIAALRLADRRVLSQHRLRTIFGIEAVGRAPLSRGWWRWARPRHLAEFRHTLGAVRARLAARGWLGPHRRIGVLGSIEGPWPEVVAEGLTRLMANAPQDLASREAGPGRSVADFERAGGDALTMVLALPPPDRSAAAQRHLRSLDAAILIVDTNRTTVAEVDAALGALREAEVALAGTLLAR